MITGFVRGQQLKLSSPLIVADTIDYLTALFTFHTRDWDGLTKWVHFVKDGTVYDISLTDDCIRKEDHLNLSAGIWKVYLHGNEFADGEVVERITTCVDTLQVLPTGSLDGEPFPEIPASETERILARLEKLEKSGGSGGGSGKGVENFLLGVTTDSGIGTSGYRLIIVLENGDEHTVELPDMGIALSDVVTVADTAPTASTDGAEGELWFDKTAKILYICTGEKQQDGGIVVPGLHEWVAAGGAADNLPEITEADEGKVLRIVDGVAAWADATAGGVSVSYDEETGNLTITSDSGAVSYDEETGNLTIGGK